MALDGFGDAFAGDPCDGRLAGCVDIEHADGVGVRERCAEFFQQVARAGIAMRLEDCVDTLESALARCRESGADLRGMMAVIVNHADAGGRALELEAAINAAKVFQSFADLIGSNIQTNTDGDRGRGVQHVVVARDLKMKAAQRFAAVLHGEVRVTLVVGCAVDGAGLDAKVGGEPRHEAAKLIVVIAQDEHSVERNAVHEIHERLLHVRHVAIAIHVLAIDVGHHGENGRELQERAVTLVGLRDQVLRLAQTRVRAHGVDASADHDRRIEPAGRQHRCDHAGGGGLAVHARDGDSVLEPHEFGQHFRALDYGNMLRAGRGDFRIFARDGGAGDHDFSAGDVLRAMAFKNDGAQIGQALGDGGRLEVGAGDFVAKCEQDLGDPAHADAAYAYEMYTLNLGKHFFSRECTRIHANLKTKYHH